MSGIRETPIPIDHLTAEMAAWPIASVSALELAPLSLDPCCEPGAASSSSGVRTRRLWRAAEKALLSSFPAFSVDEAVAVRDWLWFPREQKAGPISMAAYLRELARRLLVVSGPLAVPNAPDLLHSEGREPAGYPDVPAARARRFFRWLSFALPPHLLLAAHPDGPLRLDLSTPSLAHMLADRGFVEPHLHVGAGLRFVDLWVSAIATIGDVPPQKFCSPGAEFQEGAELAGWMLRIATVRQWLAAFLAKGTTALFDGWLLGVLGGLSPVQSHLARHEVWDTVATGRLGPAACDPATSAALKALLEEFCPFYASRPKRYDELHSYDPIALWLGRRQEEPPERRFIVCGLQYIENHPQDLAFQALFYQVIRVQGVFYRHVVQRPMTPGLQWFIRFYSRISPGRRLLGSMKLMTEAAAVVCGRDRGLRSLEVRTAPEKIRQNIKGLESAADELNRADDAGHQLEMGLVLHLTKSRGDEARRGHPSAHGRGFHADPQPYGATNGFGYRFGTYYDLRRAQVLALADHFENYPYLLKMVRGIDACTDELGIPNWVLAPLFRYIIRVSAAAAHVLALEEPDVRLHFPRCRRTIHVGEDFVHLQGGLRRIDEAIQFLPLEQGDRLGHGLALGVDPIKWCRRSGRLPLTREERLFDLTWEWRLNSTGKVSTRRDVLLESELRRVATLVFGEPTSPEEVDQLVRDLYDDSKLRWAGFPGGRPYHTMTSSHRSLPVEKRLQRLHHYLTQSEVYQQGQVIEWVDAETDAEALSILSDYLRQRVARLGLIVEVNPSSNLLIGHLGQMKDHPLWRLRPPDSASELVPVRICVGSDDPLTFATALPDEYQLLSDTMEAIGFTAAQRYEWLEGVRRTGMDGRFTLPWRSPPKIWQHSPGFMRPVALPP